MNLIVKNNQKYTSTLWLKEYVKFVGVYTVDIYIMKIEIQSFYKKNSVENKIQLYGDDELQISIK